MDYKIIKSVVFIAVLILFGCGSSEEEADYNYKNAMEHYSQINKNPEKRKDALYFFNLAVKNEKYKTVSTAKYIYSLASEILIANTNITIDDKFELTKNIIKGVEILIDLEEKSNGVDNKELIEEAGKIVNSDDSIYVMIRKILNEKSKDNFNRIKLLIHK